MIASPEVIAIGSGNTTGHRRAADMDASAEPSQMGAAYARPSAKTADVRASAKSAHVPATATTTAAVTATTTTTATRIGRADSYC